MKDEIKEILDRLERIDHKEYSGGFEFADSGTFDETGRCFEERKKLADYITNLQKENKQLKERIDKAIDNCKKSIECINQKLQDDKTIKVIDGKVVNMNEYQIVRLKAIRMKCKELLEILGDKENE